MRMTKATEVLSHREIAVLKVNELMWTKASDSSTNLMTPFEVVSTRITEANSGLYSYKLLFVLRSSHLL